MLRSLPVLLVLGALPGHAEVTYSKDVAPIFFARCTSCHHANSLAPMSLMSYQDARPWAASIRESVATRRMPPWHADPAIGHFRNDRRLTDREVAVIREWTVTGAKEGNPRDLPPAPKYAEGWVIGAPDAVVTMTEPYLIKAGGASPDTYTKFMVPTNFTEDRWVTAVELRPGNIRAVHHAHVFIHEPPSEKKAPAALAKPAIPSMRTVSFTYSDGKTSHAIPDAPIVNDGCSQPNGGTWPGRYDNELNTMLASYLPGGGGHTYAPGLARLVPAGSTLEFSIHYNGAGLKQDETDQSSVGFIFAKEPPVQMLHRIDIHNHLFAIPAGASSHEVRACYTFPKDVLLTSYTAHMHLRGKDMQFEAVHPDGRREVIFSVPHYDFNWQTEYQNAEPVAMEKGTRVEITAHFDNSVNNRYNPDPSRLIRWGEPSDEEMMDGWFEFIVPGEKLPPAPGRISAAAVTGNRP